LNETKYYVYRYEWSVGISDSDLPEGVFDDKTERVWHDAATNTRWVFSLPRGTDLISSCQMPCCGTHRPSVSN